MTPASARAALAPSGGARRSFRIVAGCLLAAGLSACSQTGDFGRPKPNVVNDTILPVAGSALANARGSRSRNID